MLVNLTYICCLSFIRQLRALCKARDVVRGSFISFSVIRIHPLGPVNVLIVSQSISEASIVLKHL